MRSRIRRPNVGSSRLGEKSRSTTERTFLVAVGASFACPRGRPTFLTEFGIPIKVPSRTRLQRIIVFSGLSVADQASQCWWAVIEEQGCCKAAGVEWVAQQMARDISKCGYHRRVVLRSDQEPALQERSEKSPDSVETYPQFSKPVLSETVRVTGSSRGQCVRLRRWSGLTRSRWKLK